MNEEETSNIKHEINIRQNNIYFGHRSLYASGYVRGRVKVNQLPWLDHETLTDHNSPRQTHTGVAGVAGVMSSEPAIISLQDTREDLRWKLDLVEIIEEVSSSGEDSVSSFVHFESESVWNDQNSEEDLEKTLPRTNLHLIPVKSDCKRQKTEKTAFYFTTCCPVFDFSNKTSSNLLSCGCW